MKRWLSWLLPTAPGSLVYMLQQFEYDTGKFARWMLGYPDLWSVRRRGTYVPTVRGKATRLYAYIVYGLWIVLAIAAALGNAWYLCALLASGVVTGYLLIVLNAAVQLSVVGPRQRREIRAAQHKLLAIPASRVAVLGSFGKTSMKELLVTVLSEGKKVAATPGNKNVLISHARWINRLDGDEEVLIIEYGEAAPGDISRFAGYSKPTHAVVTGIAPAHLDYYPSLQAVADDFAAVLDEVEPTNVWFNAHSELLRQPFDSAHGYTASGLDAVKVHDVQVDLTGTSFVVTEGKKRATYHTGLLGEHHIGPLLAVIAVARRFGLSEAEIKRGVEKTLPYEHRMQPKPLHGAWIIDDAYNGNIEGMRAGLQLLMKLPAKRRIYVTPGLVDQGDETERVHQELGRLIAQANPDRVVLMQNTNTDYIVNGMTAGDYAGDVTIETDPLGYYNSLEHHLAAGDIVMLQNDLPDSYA